MKKWPWSWTFILSCVLFFLSVSRMLRSGTMKDGVKETAGCCHYVWSCDWAGLLRCTWDLSSSYWLAVVAQFSPWEDLSGVWPLCPHTGTTVVPRERLLSSGSYCTAWPLWTCHTAVLAAGSTSASEACHPCVPTWSTTTRTRPSTSSPSLTVYVMPLLCCH